MCLDTEKAYRWIKIEQKGMTFDHDFSHSLPLFSSLLKKGKKKRRMKSKYRDHGLRKSSIYPFTFRVQRNKKINSTNL